MEPIKLSANITRIEFVIASTALLLTRRSNLVMMLIVACGTFAVVWSERESTSAFVAWIALVTAIAATVLAQLLGVLLNGFGVLLMVNHKGGGLGLHDFSISEAGVTETTAFNDLRFTWAGIREVIKLRNHLLLTITGHSGIMIPRRAFASDNEFESWSARTLAWSRRPPEKTARDR